MLKCAAPHLRRPPEAFNRDPFIVATRSPVTLDSTKMPGTVRIYVRWQATRGQLGSWSAPLTVHVA